MQEPKIEPGNVLPPSEALGEYRRRVTGMLDRLEVLASDWFAATPAQSAESAARLRELAEQIDHALQLYVQDGEKDVFPALLAAARSPSRRARAFEFVACLLVDQFDMVKSWQPLRHALVALSSDAPPSLSADVVAVFLARARRHLAREEADLFDLLGMIDEAQSQRIAMSISQRHEAS